jgi:16S rRNA (guanine(966)-N(2))-methyltransferase RsmD
VYEESQTKAGYVSGPRVIAGLAKGRKLLMVPGGKTRPVSDRAKESLFNIIGSSVVETRFLDLFAGTGSVGIEALSRGAAKAVFTDIQQAAIETIHANLEKTNFLETAMVLRRDAFEYIHNFAGQPFDYIYIAPPQYQDLWHQAVLAIDARITCLNPDAWVIAQMHPEEYAQLDLTHLLEFDQRRYGSTLLVFFEYLGE